MSGELQQTDQDRQRYRSFYHNNIEDSSRARADQYAKFMAERFPDEQSKQYMLEWAQRFRDSTHWYKMDMKSQKVMLKVMCTSQDGTAAELNPEILMELGQEIKEARR